MFMDLAPRGDTSVDHELHQVDVGWPLLRYGKSLSRSSCLMCEATPQDGRLEDAEKSFSAVEIEVERQPPFALLKPCRQLEKHYSATRRSIAGQLTSLKTRLDRIGEDHSHGRFTARETTSKEIKEVTHKPSEAHVAFATPAEAKFLAESFELPLYSSVRHDAVVIPFKWEDAPGKAKLVDAVARSSSALQLPPQLVPVRLVSNIAMMRMRHLIWLGYQTSQSSSQPNQMSHLHHGYVGNQPGLLPESCSIHL